MPVIARANEIVFIGTAANFRRLSSCASFYAAIVLGGDTQIVSLPQGDGEILFYFPAHLSLENLERFVRVYVAAFILLVHNLELN